MMDDYISRQAAIDAVSEACFELRGVFGRCEDAIKALPSAQPDTDEWCTDCKEYDSERHCCPRWNRVIRETLKDAQPERKSGKWKREVLGSTSGYGTTVMYQCSNCENMAISQYHFCPNCGADMRGGDDENDRC